MSRRSSQPSMITEATPNAAPSQKTAESAATYITTAPATAQTLKRLLTIRSTILDCVAPAKSDQVSMLMVRADLVDCMAGARVSPNATCPRTRKHQLSQVPTVTMKQWHEVMAC